MPEKKTSTTTTKTTEPAKPKGRYISTIGRRKTSVARIRLFKKGTGVIIVNDQKLSEYFAEDKVTIVKQALKLTGNTKDMDASIVVKGGGSQGQAEAIRHGLSRALIEIDEECKASLKAKGWVSRDARKKERKKPGLKKARRAPQWSKR